MTRDNVLKHITEIGMRLAHAANPDSYPVEDRARAGTFITALHAARSVYRAIRAGGDVVAWLRRFQGAVAGSCQYNHVNLLLQANLGILKPDGIWAVVDGDLVKRL